MILITYTTKPRHPVLCGKKAVHQFEQEASEVTPQTLNSGQSPNLTPLKVAMQGNTAVSPARVGGIQEALSHLGGHSIWKEQSDN